jgi:hypothetical protein
MLVALDKTELVSLEMTADGIGTFPSPLLEQDGDFTPILKDRVV